MRITPEHIEHWQRHGYVVIPGFLTSDELAAARDGAAHYLPSYDEYAAAPERYRGLMSSTFYKGLVSNEFPYATDGLNNISTHPEIISFVEHVLGVDDINMTQSLLWGKYPELDDFEQAHHVDFQNNSLAFPRDDGPFRQVPFICYYTDVDDETGPTCVVSHEVSGDGCDAPWGRPREQFPQLYEHEVKVTGPAGTLVIYSMRTFHRGSRFVAKDRIRISNHFVYAAAAYRWMGFQSWAHKGNEANMQRFIQQATPRQREMLGFPAPGHEYWNEATLVGVARRYPAMDMEPYRAAMRAGAVVGLSD